jgi:hypothetical protein
MEFYLKMKVGLYNDNYSYMQPLLKFASPPPQAKSLFQLLLEYNGLAFTKNTQLEWVIFEIWNCVGILKIRKCTKH